VKVERIEHSSCGLSERPKPTRSGATTRAPRSTKRGIMRRKRYLQVGSPCRQEEGALALAAFRPSSM